MIKSRKLLEDIVTAIVENKEAVQITDSSDDMGILLTLTVAREDMGKIVGREGSTAKAIRSLLHTVGMTENARVSLKINEPEGSTRREPRE